MSLNNAIVAANTAKNLNFVLAVLNFISAYPSEEGKKAVKAFWGAVISSLAIIFFVMMPLVIGAVLYFDREPDMPDGATYKKPAVASKVFEDQFGLRINGEIVKYKISDYTDETFDKGENLHIYFNDNNEIVAIESQDDPLGMFLLFGMLTIPITLLLGNALIGRNTYFKWWKLYCNWYVYEIAPLTSQSNFHELVKDKKYYNVLIKTSALVDEDKKLYKKYNGFAIAGGIGIVLSLIVAVVIDTLLKFKFGLETNTKFVWIVSIILVFALCFFTMHFDKKARETKEKYIKKDSV